MSAEDWSGQPCKRLKKLLKDNKLSGAEVARRLGLTAENRRTVNAWTKGTNCPRADTLARIIQMCPGGSADVVLGITETPVAQQFVSRLAAMSDLVGGLQAPPVVVEFPGTASRKPRAKRRARATRS